MEAIAKLKNARISAQRVRLVADKVRGVPVERALQTLTFSTKKAAAKKETAQKIVDNITWENWEDEKGKHYSTNDVLLNRIEWLKGELFDEQTEGLDTLWMLENVLELVDVDKILK